MHKLKSAKAAIDSFSQHNNLELALKLGMDLHCMLFVDSANNLSIRSNRMMELPRDILSFSDSY
jgi:hypothetical protein